MKLYQQFGFHPDDGIYIGAHVEEHNGKFFAGCHPYLLFADDKKFALSYSGKDTSVFGQGEDEIFVITAVKTNPYGLVLSPILMHFLDCFRARIAEVCAEEKEWQDFAREHEQEIIQKSCAHARHRLGKERDALKGQLSKVAEDLAWWNKAEMHDITRIPFDDQERKAYVRKRREAKGDVEQG